MRNYGKKVLAILLALVMILAQIPVLSSAAEEGKPAILHQPSYSQPYVEATGSPVSYQWYYDTYIQVQYPAVAEGATASQVNVVPSFGTWDAENGVYRSISLEGDQHCLTLEFAELQEGDVIYIPDFLGNVVDVYNTIGRTYEMNDGTIVEPHEYEHPTSIVLSIDPTVDNVLGEFSIAPVIQRMEESSKAIEGQNKATYQLSEAEDYAAYCVITYQNGTVLKSNSMYLSYYCYSQPTVKNPTALFTWDSYITGYQWFRHGFENLTWNIGDGDSYGRELLHNWSFYYDNDNGCYVANMEDSTNAYVESELFLYKGDVVTFTMSEGFGGTALFEDYSKSDGQFAPTLTEGKYTFIAEDDLVLNFILEDDAAFGFSITINGEVGIFSPMEGETSKTLKTVDVGSYLCIAYYKVGEAEFEQETYFDVELQITKEPTSENPTVEINLPGKATFQWYRSEKVDFSGYFVAEGSGVEGVTGREYSGWFNANDKTWNAECGRINVGVPITDGTTISVTVPDGFDGFVGGYDGMSFEFEDGVYSATFYDIEEYYDLFIESYSLDTYAVSICVDGKVNMPVAVEGQNKATLTVDQVGSYHCVVSGSDNRILTSSTVDYFYDFVQQPTEEKPELIVSFADQVESYQWYSVVREDFSGYLTEEQLDRFADYIADIQDDGTWKSVEFAPYKNVVVVQTGQASIKMDIHENATVTGFYEKLEDGTYTSHQFYGLALFIHSEEPFTVKPFFTIETTDEVEVEGQTTAAYTGPKTGKYFCEVTYKDGEVIRSNRISYEPSIEEEPSTDLPTFEVTNSDQVKSYQWFVYKETVKSDSLKPEHVCRTYNMYKNNKWQAIQFDDNIYGFYMDLVCSEGDKLTLNVPEGVTVQVDADGATYKDGVLTAEEDYMSIYIMAEQSFELTAKWDYTDYTSEAVSDQTTDTLTPKGPGYYYCVATYQDGTELQSTIIDFMQEIVTYPTDDAPVVEMLWPELVEKYEWYQVSYIVKNVTNASEASDTEIPGREIQSSYSDGVWYAEPDNSDVRFFAVDLKENDVIYINTVGNSAVECVICFNESDGSGEYMDMVSDSEYEYVCYMEGTYFIYVAYSEMTTSDDGVRASVKSLDVGEPVQGQKSAIFTGTKGSYFCVVTDKDGKEYKTNIFTVSDYYMTKLPAEGDFTVQVNDPDDVESYQWFVLEDVVATRPAVPIDPADDEVEAYYSQELIYHNSKWYAVDGYFNYFALYVEKGDEVIIKPSAEFAGEIIFEQGFDYFTFEEKDGAYIISITEDIGMISFCMDNNDNGFQFEAAVKGSKKVAKAVEGAVSSSFEADASGEYFCVITMKDGTKLTSNIVKYEKPAEPPVVEDVPPTGDNVMVITFTVTSLMAAVAVLLLGWDLKRKF